MGKKQFSDEQIAFVLGQFESCPKPGSIWLPASVGSFVSGSMAHKQEPCIRTVLVGQRAVSG